MKKRGKRVTREWLEEQIKAGKTLREIGEELGLSKQRVWAIVHRKYGIPLLRPKRQPWTPKEDMILREKYLECSDRELAEKWLPGRTENAIERRRARLGLTKKKKEIPKNGRLEVITGPMFAGKTEELMRRLERARFAKKSFMTFKSSLDTRYDKTMIVSHSKRTMEAIPIPSGITCAQFFDQFGKEIEKVEIIAFDEAQFFRKKEFLKIIRELLRQGKRVIIAGLDLTFKGEPFGPMPELLALADEVIKLTAICEICGNPATKTQRLINGKPVVSGPTVIVGAKEGEITYRAVCNAHFIWK